MKLKNILITGGAGFIGSHLALRLSREGYCVTILDNLLPQIHGEYPEKESFLYKSIIGKVKFIKGDVRNPQDWEKALPHQEMIIHLASETGTGQSMYEMSRYVKSNVLGLSVFLDLLVKDSFSVKKIILSSSRAVYGEGSYIDSNKNLYYADMRKLSHLKLGIFDPIFTNNENIFSPHYSTEDTIVKPTSIYGITKYTQEQLLLTAGQSLGIESVVLRLQNVYGEGQPLRNPYTGIISILSNRMRNNEPVYIFEDGKQLRNFIHISDVIEAFILAIKTENIGQEVFNIGSQYSCTINEMVEILQQNINTFSNIGITGQFRLGDVRHCICSIEKAKNILGFNPKISLEEGIVRFLEWVETQKPIESQLMASLEEMKARKMLFDIDEK